MAKCNQLTSLPFKGLTPTSSCHSRSFRVNCSQSVTAAWQWPSAIRQCSHFVYRQTGARSADGLLRCYCCCCRPRMRLVMLSVASVCLCVCPIMTLAFENIDLWNSFSVCRYMYVLRISIGHVRKSRSSGEGQGHRSIKYTNVTKYKVYVHICGWSIDWKASMSSDL